MHVCPGKTQRSAKSLQISPKISEAKRSVNKRLHDTSTACFSCPYSPVHLLMQVVYKRYSS